LTNDQPAPIIFDDASAMSLLSSGANPAHLLEIDDALRATGGDFAAEQTAGPETLRRHLRAWTRSHEQKEDVAAVIKAASRIRERFRVFVVVGIGGSDLGGRTLHDALDDPFHNERSIAERGDAPRIYFTGDTFDPKRLVTLLDMLEARGELADTCVNIVSKSGATGETIVAAMVLRERMRRAGVADWAQHVVATTGQNEKSVLFVENKATAFFAILPVPDGVGGRFSFASPVGLLPFAVTAPKGVTPAERLDAALAGYAEAHRRFLLPVNDPANSAAQLARWWHFGELYGGKSDLVFCNYADDGRLGDWFVQLYEESVQERGAGLNVIGTRGPTGNHSILNGILRGPHDKLVLMLRWLDYGANLEIPRGTGVGGDLATFEGLTYSNVQDASCRATVADYLANGIPTATLTLAKRDPFRLFLVMRTLMDAVAFKGRLQHLHVRADGASNPATELTYLQHGVEGYKARTRELAAAMHGDAR
jgi:glucose-6-phosphate isomerase